MSQRKFAESSGQKTEVEGLKVESRAPRRDGGWTFALSTLSRPFVLAAELPGQRL
jgi:hypothetical protein